MSYRSPKRTIFPAIERLPSYYDAGLEVSKHHVSYLQDLPSDGHYIQAR